MRYLRFVLLGLLAMAALVAGPVPVAHAATFTVDSTGDAVDANPGDGTCATAGAVCTLRAAIEEANALSATDTINFSIAGAGPHTISPGSALPTITEPVIIDGYSQPEASPNTNGPGFGSNAVLKIELDGNNAGSSASGLTIAAGDSTVRGLVINRFDRDGIRIQTNGGNVIDGNFIGTDIMGTAALANDRGLLISESPNNTIGGTSEDARNVISGNDKNRVFSSGVFISGSTSTGNLLQGNFIGTDATGTVALANQDGVLVRNAPNNTIGGTVPGARNLISGNRIRGVLTELSGTTDNLVQGNFIGTDVNGTTDLGNSATGVVIGSGASNNIIGGTTAGAGNVISDNDIHGVEITGSSSARNVVQGNYIGTDVNGTADLGNTNDGVSINRAPNNIIGGTAAGAGNTIAFNGGNGVHVNSGTGNLIDVNSIHSSTGLGIDLGGDGVTPNDVGDGDTGANNLQNFTVLTSATIGSSTDIEGSLNSTASTEFTLEFFYNDTCDPSGYGEGETYLGSTTVTTDGTGNLSFSVSFGTTLSVGQYITATATDPDKNTSEFSECAQVLPPPVTIVDIDIKPGSDSNSINPESRGNVPVAILSSPDFDAPSEVDMASLTFGSAGDEESLAKCPRGSKDVNGDGLLDQVCHFNTQETGFQCGDTEGILRGQTADGVPIEGRDSARIASCR